MPLQALTERKDYVVGGRKILSQMRWSSHLPRFRLPIDVAQNSDHKRMKSLVKWGVQIGVHVIAFLHTFCKSSCLACTYLAGRAPEAPIEQGSTGVEQGGWGEANSKLAMSNMFTQTTFNKSDMCVSRRPPSSASLPQLLSTCGRTRHRAAVFVASAICLGD